MKRSTAVSRWPSVSAFSLSARLSSLSAISPDFPAGAGLPARRRKSAEDGMRRRDTGSGCGGSSSSD
jgi:hypothetical protein